LRSVSCYLQSRPTVRIPSLVPCHSGGVTREKPDINVRILIVLHDSILELLLSASLARGFRRVLQKDARIFQFYICILAVSPPGHGVDLSQVDYSLHFLHLAFSLIYLPSSFSTVHPSPHCHPIVPVCLTLIRSFRFRLVLETLKVLHRDRHQPCSPTRLGINSSGRTLSTSDCPPCIISTGIAGLFASSCLAAEPRYRLGIVLPGHLCSRYLDLSLFSPNTICTVSADHTLANQTLTQDPP
jgi:hypothetical protein